MESFKSLVEKKRLNIDFIEAWEDLVNKVDIVIISTAWPEYMKLQSMNLKSTIVFDARRILRVQDLSAKDYLMIGFRSLQ